MTPIFKVYVFACGCKQMATFFPRSSGCRKCPEHKKLLLRIIRPCAGCGVIINTRAARGKLKWCDKCRKRGERKVNRDIAANHRKENKKPKRPKELKPAPQSTQKEALDNWYRGFKFVPPVVETPVLDRIYETIL